MLPQKMMFRHLITHHKYSTLHLTQDHHLPCTLTTYEHLVEEAAEEEDFQTVPWTMNIGLLKRFLTDHYAYMNIHYHMDYACTCVHMQITRLPSTWRPWI